MCDDPSSSPQEHDDPASAHERERAAAVKARVEAELMALPGVTGVATGPKLVAGRRTDTWAIRVYVAQKRDVEPALALPHEIEGVPVDVIERSFVPHRGSSEPPDERGS